MKALRLATFIALLASTACGMAYLLLRPKARTFQNRTMARWLQILSTGTNSNKSPLSVVRITEDAKSPVGTIEVPLSYDLVKQHDFCERQGKFDLIINGRYVSTTCWRGTNGNCLLPFDKSDLNPGTNQIQVYFIINNPSDIDLFLHAKGPITELISSNGRP